MKMVNEKRAEVNYIIEMFKRSGQKTTKHLKRTCLFQSLYTKKLVSLLLNLIELQTDHSKKKKNKLVQCTINNNHEGFKVAKPTAFDLRTLAQV